jgi:hypothetical protein
MYSPFTLVCLAKTIEEQLDLEKTVMHQDRDLIHQVCEFVENSVVTI